MKKRKIITIFLFLFVLTACTPKYKVTIENGTIHEKIAITVDSLTFTSASDNQENDISKIQYYAYGEPHEENLYQKQITKNKKGYTMTLSYTHTADKFKDAAALKYFKYPVYVNTDDYIYIKLQGGLVEGLQNQLTSEGAEVSVETDNRVIHHNADYVKGNTYTWKITKYNAKQKEIVFQVSKEIKQATTSSKGNTILFVFIVVGITGGSIVLLWYLGQRIIKKRF